MSPEPRILFCNCTYAQVVPREVKEKVLRALCDSGIAFEAVADLCEAAARRDPVMERVSKGPVKIAACYPRAVKWLFGMAGAPLGSTQTEVLNMRILPAAEVVQALCRAEMQPNLSSAQTVSPHPGSEQVLTSRPAS